MTPGMPGRTGGAGSDDEPTRPETALAETLQDHLLEQLRLTRAEPRDCALITLLIQELDENGYLPTSLDEVLACLPQELIVEPDEVGRASCRARVCQDV